MDLASMYAEPVHRGIAVIFQDFARYQLTARENIGLGAVEHLDDQAAVEAAARHAGADTYLTALPNGYETILSRSATAAGTCPSASGSALRWPRHSSATHR